MIGDAAQDDALLSDHEWRAKQAREGRAIYVPGRTDEEIRAEAEAPAPFSLTKGQARVLAERVEDSMLLLVDAQEALAFLARLHRDGDHDGHLGFGAVASLAERAIRKTCDEHAGDLEDLVEKLRIAGKREDAA
ncbi:MAG: hypothetical protein ACK4L4_05865 [Gemmobacter sp.]